MYKLTPPMGWNSWNTYGEKINETLICETADAMVSSGLKDCGYEYVVIDDCWSLRERDENGFLVADPEKFPHGIKFVADYIHSKGLKFGMYSCAGALTCAGYPGSYDYEFKDAQTFADWGVDFLKYDFCNRSTVTPAHLLYKRMGSAIAATGRDILFSACSWGGDNTRAWIKETNANMWRSTGDIADGWDSICTLIRQEMKTMEYNGQSCFNDLDMLVVGMDGKGNVAQGGCSYDAYLTHFAFWCLFGSPLMIGCDIRNMNEQTKQILMNKELIRIDQDLKYNQPFFINHTMKESQDSKFLYQDYPEDVPVMAKYLSDGTIAIGFFNLTNHDITGWWQTICLTDALGIPASSGKTLKLRDIFTGEEIIAKGGSFRAGMQPQCCRMFIATVVDQ